MSNSADPKATLAIGAAGSGYSLLGLPWAEIAAVLTVVFLVMQIVNLAPTIMTKFRNWRSGKGWKE